MEQFKPIRCLIVECAVRTFRVVKFYVGINTSHELVLEQYLLCPINLLPFHGGKEGLGYSIVMRTAGLRERLDNLVHEAVSGMCWMYIAGPGRYETSAAEARFCPNMHGER